jgi:hypothetical protein
MVFICILVFHCTWLGYPFMLVLLATEAAVIVAVCCCDRLKKRQVQRIIHDTSMINIYIDRFIRALRPTRHSYVRLIISWSETIGFIAKWSFKTMLCDLPEFSKHLGGETDEHDQHDQHGPTGADTRMCLSLSRPHPLGPQVWIQGVASAGKVQTALAIPYGLMVDSY